MLDAVIDFSSEESVDVAFFTGDMFHTNDPIPVYLNEVSKRLVRLAEVCPVVCLVGNHDQASFDKPSSVEVYNTLQVPNIHIGNKYEILDIETKHGMISVATLPYPTRHIIGDDVRSRPVEKTKQLIREHVASIINGMVQELSKVSESIPAVLLGHFSVNGSIYGIEKSFLMGTDAEVDIDMLTSPVWSYVGLGHIHKFQVLNDDPPVIYAGSTERVSFNEEHEDKGFIIGTIEGVEAAKWEFVKLDARPYVTVSATITKGNPTNKIIAKIENTDVKDAVVRVKASVAEELQLLIDRSAIQDAILDAGAYCVSNIIINIVRDYMTRLSADKFNTSMTPTHLLEVYLRDSIGKNESDIKVLLRDAERFMVES
jgi:exonuclease SbcD